MQQQVQNSTSADGRSVTVSVSNNNNLAVGLPDGSTSGEKEEADLSDSAIDAHLSEAERELKTLGTTTDASSAHSKHAQLSKMEAELAKLEADLEEELSRSSGEHQKIEGQLQRVHDEKVKVDAAEKQLESVAQQ